MQTCYCICWNYIYKNIIPTPRKIIKYLKKQRKTYKLLYKGLRQDCFEKNSRYKTYNFILILKTTFLKGKSLLFFMIANNIIYYNNRLRIEVPRVFRAQQFDHCGVHKSHQHFLL